MEFAAREVDGVVNIGVVFFLEILVREGFGVLVEESQCSALPLGAVVDQKGFQD